MSLRPTLFCSLLAAPFFLGAATVPLHFEAAANGSLVAREGPYNLAVESGRTTVTIGDRANHRSATVVTRLAGAERSQPTGEEPMAAKASYFLSSDAASWRTGVPLFSRAVERGVYRGIDLVFHGDSGSLEYDFLVHPEGHARQIALDISGASSLRVEPDGSLVIATSAGEIRWNKPVVYQWKDGARQSVAGAFALHGHRVTFALGAYDRTRDLVIDPTLAYGTYFGGNDNEASRGVAVDGAGNIYITGFTYSLNLAVTSGAFQTANHGGTAFGDVGGDVFVAKYTPAGALSYVTYLGGSGDDAGAALAVDSAGNVYLTGFTTSVNFPTVKGSLQTTFGGQGTGAYFQNYGDAFVAKLNPAGSALIYSTYLGGSNDEQGTSIAVDSAGNAYVGGATLSTNFPTASAYQSTFHGGGGSPAFCCGSSAPFMQFGDGFLAKLNPAGTALLFSTYFGGTLDDTITGLALDGSGNVYVGGTTVSANFPTLNPYQSKFGGAANANAQPVITTGDGFVAKFNSSGALQYSTYLGGSSDDAVMAIAVDSTGAAYVTGFTSSANFPVTAGVAQKSLSGPSAITGQRGFVWGDAFVTKLAPTGSSLVWSTFLGGTQDDAGMAIVLDNGLNPIIGGFANSTNLPVTSNAQQATFGGNSPADFSDPTGDAFLAKVSADGTTFQYVSYYGGNSSDAITSVALNASGQVIVTGATTSTNLPHPSGAAQPAFGGNGATETEDLGDAFMAIFSGIANVAATSTITNVTNAASFTSALAPGSAATVFGTNLPTTTSAGASVGGQPAQVAFASATQWTIVIPNNATLGPSTVQVGSSAPFSITLTQYAPALFTTLGGTPTIVTAERVLVLSTPPITAAAPALPGDTVYLFATGLGATDANGRTATLPTVNLGGTVITATAAVLSSAGSGVYQVTFQIPLTISAGTPSVVLSIGGLNSQASTLPIGTLTGPVITAVVNGASFLAGLSANTWGTIYGANLSSVTDTWNNYIVNGVLPTKFDGVSVSVGGQLAYLEYIDSNLNLINFVAPNVVAPGPVQVTVTNGTATSASFTVNATQYGPAFFEWPNSQVVATRTDYTFAAAPGTFAGLTTVAAKPGDVLVLWGTGFGPTNPAAPVGVQVPSTTTYNVASPVTVTINNVNATYYGGALAPGFAALYQIAIQVPTSMPDGTWPIVASIGGVQSTNTVMLVVHQ